MNWITINKNKCNLCGLCAMTCRRCFSRSGEEILVQADEDNCIICGHCVAVCPNEAISHGKISLENFQKIEKPASIPADTFLRFIKERRSHRLFQPKPIPPEDLDRLIDVVRYAPTGANVQSVEMIIVQDPARKKSLSDLTIDFFDKAGTEAAERLKSSELKPPEAAMLQKTIDYRERMLKARNEGLDPIFYNAPVVFIFHSAIQAITSKDNCVIASTTLGLFARTLGLESTYIGLFQIAAQAYPPIMASLGLPEGHRVFSVLIVGYPELKFLRTIDRKPLKPRWE